jgi:hypothetical protein
MGRGKKIGVVLILAGLCIPILAMIFASGYKSQQDLIWNIKNTEVVFWKQTSIIPTKSSADIFDKVDANRKDEAHGPSKDYDPLELYHRKITTYHQLPCSVFFGVGIILTAIGIGLVILSKDGKTITK